MTLTIVSTSESNTIKIGEIIGSFIVPGDVILLSGDLGSGKTKVNFYLRKPSNVLACFLTRIHCFHKVL